jgi:hypothetical protein
MDPDSGVTQRYDGLRRGSFEVASRLPGLSKIRVRSHREARRRALPPRNWWRTTCYRWQIGFRRRATRLSAEPRRPCERPAGAARPLLGLTARGGVVVEWLAALQGGKMVTLPERLAEAQSAFRDGDR